EHVVEKADGGSDIGLTDAVQIKRHEDLGLSCLASNARSSWHAIHSLKGIAVDSIISRRLAVPTRQDPAPGYLCPALRSAQNSTQHCQEPLDFGVRAD